MIVILLIILSLSLLILFLGFLNFADYSLQSIFGFSNALIFTIGLIIIYLRYRKRSNESVDLKRFLLKKSSTGEISEADTESLNSLAKHAFNDRLGFGALAIGFGIATIRTSIDFLPLYFSSLLVGILLATATYFLFYVPATMAIDGQVTEFWKEKVASEARMYKYLIAAILFISSLLGGYLEYLN